MRRPRVKSLLLALAAAALLPNGLVALHAYRLTHFVEAGLTTRKPEQLGFGEKLRVALSGPRLVRPGNAETPAEYGLAFEVVAIAPERGPRLEAWHVARRDAETLVLGFHGYFDAKDSLLPAARILNELGYATLLVDFRGSGGSEGRSTTIGYREAEDVAAAARAARRLGAHRLVLYGASMGAAAVLRAVAEEGVAADALLLEAPFDALVKTVGHRCRAAGVPAFPCAPLVVFWGGLLAGFDGFDHNPRDYAARTRVPALLMAGSRDERVAPAETEAVYTALAGPKTLVRFPGLGHVLLARADAERWRVAVGRFLAAPSGGDAIIPGAEEAR